MEKENNIERMVAVETELKGITSLLEKLDSKFDKFQEIYVPRSELNEMFKQRDDRLNRLEDSKRNYPAWISAVVAIVALAVAYFRG